MLTKFLAQISQGRGEKNTLLLALFLIGISITFFSFLAMYWRLRLRSDWQQVSLPSIFWISTCLIVLSSFSIHWANTYFDREKFKDYRSMLWFTLLLGIAFCFTQIMGWGMLQQRKVFLQGSPAGSFLYIISGLHLLHILGGIAAIGVLVWQAYKNFSYVDAYVYSLNAPNILRLRLVTAYWHFVDILWIVLFVFFLLNTI